MQVLLILGRWKPNKRTGYSRFTWTICYYDHASYSSPRYCCWSRLWLKTPFQSGINEVYLILSYLLASRLAEQGNSNHRISTDLPSTTVSHVFRVNGNAQSCHACEWMQMPQLLSTVSYWLTVHLDPTAAPPSLSPPAISRKGQVQWSTDSVWVWRKPSELICMCPHFCMLLWYPNSPPGLGTDSLGSLRGIAVVQVCLRADQRSHGVRFSAVVRYFQQKSLWMGKNRQ